MLDVKGFSKQLNKTSIAAFIASMLGGAAISRTSALTTTNPFTLLLLILLFPFIKAGLEVRSRRTRLAGALCGAFFTCACFLARLEGITQNDIAVLRYYDSFVSTIGFMCLFVPLCTFFYDKLKGLELTADRDMPSGKRRAACFFISMGIMLLCWIPYFLYVFPANITADSMHELNQAWGQEDLSNHHPIAHTALIWLTTKLGKLLFHDNTNAIAVYSVTQMILLSAAFSYFITTLYQMRVKKRFFMPMIPLFAVICYHGDFSVTMWKDVPFAGFVLVFTVTLWRILLSWKAGRKMSRFEMIMLFISGIGVCLFRSNGLYAFFFLFVFLLIFCIKYKKFPLLGITAASLAVALLIKGPLYKALDVTPPDAIESLSLPAQQISAVITADGEMTQEQWGLLSKVVDVKKVPDTYIPSISDPIKEIVRLTGDQEYLTEHKGEYLKLWLDLGLHYPQIYLIAHINQTKGYWYPDIQYWVYGDADFRPDNLEGVERRSKMSEKTAEDFRTYRDLYGSCHYLGLFWSIGLMVWLMIFMLGAAFNNRKKSLMLCYLPVLGVWATLLIATPVYAEFRYAYSLFVTVPLLCFIPFVSEKPLLRDINKPETAEVTAVKAEEKPAEAPVPETENT